MTEAICIPRRQFWTNCKRSIIVIGKSQFTGGNMELTKRSMQEVTKLGGKRITMEVGVNEVLVQFVEAIKRDSSVSLLDEIFEGFIISNQVGPDNWAIQPEIGFFVKCSSSVISTQTIELSTYVLTQVDQVLLGRWITSSVDSKESDEITLHMGTLL